MGFAFRFLTWTHLPVIAIALAGCASKPKLQMGDPWYGSARLGQTQTLQKMIDEGKGVNSQNKFGVNALMVAARSGQIETAKFLLSKGADATILDKDRQGVLAYALSGDLADGKNDVKLQLLVDVLLKAGADPFVLDNTGFQPIRAMIDNGFAEQVKSVSYTKEKPCDRVERRRGDMSLSLQARRADEPDIATFLEQQGCW